MNNTILESSEMTQPSKELRFVSRFPRGCLTSTEAIRAILNQSKDHGFLDGDIFVGDDSPQWQKDEVFLRAEALYIYSHHSNIPWDTDYDCTTVGILLVENGGIIGAVGFNNLTDFNDRDSVRFEEWGKNWRWTFAFIDPQHQRKGYLTKRISEWRERFGEFTSARAWSEAIRALFEKIGWYPAGEKSLARNQAELNKLELKELQKAGRLSRRWIREQNNWVQLVKRNELVSNFLN